MLRSRPTGHAGNEWLDLYGEDWEDVKRQQKSGRRSVMICLTEVQCLRDQNSWPGDLINYNFPSFIKFSLTSRIILNWSYTRPYAKIVTAGVWSK